MLPLAFDRAAVLAAVLLTAVLFDTKAADPINVVKLTALLLCALTVVLAAMSRAIRDRVVQLPWSPPAAAAAAMAVALTIAVVHAPNVTIALLGAPGRNNGWYAYTAGLCVFVAVLRAFDVGRVHWVLLAVLASAVFTAFYGTFQHYGIDAINWSKDFNPIIGALGNPDFASAYLGIAVPIAGWLALSRRFPAWARIAAAAVAVWFLVVAVASQAVQGPLAAMAGLAVLALAYSLDLPTARRRLALAGLGALGALGAVLVVVGAVAKAGPAAHFFTGVSYEARLWYWRAALTMFGRNPVFGIGLESYGDYWPRDRPIAAPRALGGATYSDSAHSVPLQQLAGGGLLLAGAYLALVLTVAWCIYRGLRRRAGEERLLVGAFGASWLAYQVQSLVSIDHVALLTVNLVLAAGAVVASGETRLREVRLRGALAPVTAPARGKGRKAPRQVAPRRRQVGAPDLAMLGGLAVLGLIAVWESFVPLRASHAAYDGALAAHDGNGVSAVAHYRSAQSLVGGYGVYWSAEADTYKAGGRLDDARRLYLQSFEHDSTFLTSLHNAAILSVSLDQPDRAREIYRKLLPLDPTNSSVIQDYAALDVYHGQAARMLPLLERASRDLPGDADLLALLGRARKETGDIAGARAAWERALQLMPGQPSAVAGLEALRRSAS